MNYTSPDQDMILLKKIIVLSLIFNFVNSACVFTKPGENKRIKLGTEVLFENYLDLLKGKRIGLITNPTGVTAELVSTIDVLFRHPSVQLVALYGPEHGVRGDAKAGEKVLNAVDNLTNLPVNSLYGRTKKPTAEMLKGVDLLLFDIQDIGVRTYTYIYTMALAMQAAKEENIPFIILDRPNPLGGLLVEGPVLDPKFKSFIGMYPIPYVHGMTAGELARLFNQEFEIHCDLTVIPLQGWKRSMIWEETGLEWVPTSPHIPHARTAFYYATTGCIGELHTINEGVGYTLPFELIGAPWIDAYKLAEELNSLELPGVYFRPQYYKPYYLGYKDVQLGGVNIHIMDLKKFKPMSTQIFILTTLKKLYPDQDFFATSRVDMFYKATGTDKIRTQIDQKKSAVEIIQSWQEDLNAFKKIRKKYLLY